VQRARLEARVDRPLHRGELRSGLRSPLLPGCASARIPQKQRDFANDRTLVRALEPLSTWIAALGGAADPGTIEFAWRLALENHPHDSICGCSVDAVHAQMETRFDRVQEIAAEALERVGREWISRIAPAPGGSAAAGDPFAVWHSNPAGSALVDALLELDVPGVPLERAAAGSPPTCVTRRAGASRPTSSSSPREACGARPSRAHWPSRSCRASGASFSAFT